MAEIRYFHETKGFWKRICSYNMLFVQNLILGHPVVGWGRGSQRRGPVIFSGALKLLATLTTYSHWSPAFQVRESAKAKAASLYSSP